jgi:hypothetical protein
MALLRCSWTSYPLPYTNSGTGFYPLPDESIRHPHISLFTSHFILPFTPLGALSGFLNLILKINIFANFSSLLFVLYALPNSDSQSSYSDEIQTVQVTQPTWLDVNGTYILLRHVSALIDKQRWTEVTWIVFVDQFYLLHSAFRLGTKMDINIDIIFNAAAFSKLHTRSCRNWHILWKPTCYGDAPTV